MSNFQEIEFKYYANKILRSDFDNIIKKIGGIKKDLLLFSEAENGKHSIDHYYSNKTEARFMRWREGQDKNGSKTWELTSKVKTNDLNNNVRNEVNIPLNARDMSLSKAIEFSSQHKCSYDFSIRKDVQIYWMGDIVLSHYTVFDLNGNKLNIFMEIEADESVEWESEQKALDAIVLWEKKLSVLGITAQNRIKKSLYEFYSGNITLKKEQEVSNA